ncbi:20538_t:CDS:2, partial [Cetraspora pellucida]
WVIGTYSIEHEECEIEITLFVVIDLKKRDFDTQAMIVSLSNHLKILDKVFESNKYLLKISLVGVAQEIPRKVSDNENAVFDILVNELQSSKHLKTNYIDEQDLSSVENANYLKEQIDCRFQLEENNIVTKLIKKRKLKKLTSNVDKSQKKSEYSRKKDKVYLTHSTTYNSNN